MFKVNRGGNNLKHNDGDISVCWNVTKKNITQGFYLHIIKELHGTLNNSSTNKPSRLFRVTPIFERVIVVYKYWEFQLNLQRE